MWVSLTTKLLTWHFNTAVFPDITYSSWTCTLYFWLTTETKIWVYIKDYLFVNACRPYEIYYINCIDRTILHWPMNANGVFIWHMYCVYRTLILSKRGSFKHTEFITFRNKVVVMPSNGINDWHTNNWKVLCAHVRMWAWFFSITNCWFHRNVNSKF